MERLEVIPIQCKAHPAFFQFVTDIIFKRLVQANFPVGENNTGENACNHSSNM